MESAIANTRISKDICRGCLTQKEPQELDLRPANSCSLILQRPMGICEALTRLRDMVELCLLRRLTHG